MIFMSQELITNWKKEHQELLDLLFDIISEIKAGKIEHAWVLMEEFSGKAGPLLRFEEEVVFPHLTQIISKKNVDILFQEHDDMIKTFEKLYLVLNKNQYTKEELDTAIEMAEYTLLRIASHEGLELFFERLSDSALREIVEEKDKIYKEGIDLHKWIETIRERKVLIV